jgi:tRNA A-37 threonylcarbamoyl transferase component Bud32
MLRVDKKALDAVFREVSLRMHEELDYCNESDNVRAFRAFHKRHPFVQVPEVIGHRSAKRVLTLAYSEGDHIRDFDALGYSPEERDRCGEHLWRAMESQIFDFGSLHADPNPANFAFRRDGTVVIYDFGCVKQLAPGIAAGYAELVRGALAEDYRALEQTLRTLGVRRDAGREVPDAFYKLWRDWLALPLLAAEPFDFGSAHFGQEAVSKLAPESLKYIGSFQPAPEIVFLNRTLGGHYALLRQMRARLPVKSLLRARFPDLRIP